MPDRPMEGRLRPYPPLLNYATRLLVEPTLRAPYLSTCAWLHEFYDWVPERRHEWQRSRLQQVLAHAASNVPRYRAQAGPLGNLALEDLPVVCKDVIREDTQSFLSQAQPQPSYVLKCTSGTTGERWTYPLDRRAWTHTYAAWLFFLGFTGYRYGDPLVMFGPHSARDRPHSVLDLLREKAERRHFTGGGADLGGAASERRLVEASRHGGAIWYGYPSVMAAMGRAVADRECSEAPIPFRPPSAIVTSGEMLYPLWRRQIERLFGGPVLDQYGCNDGGILTQSCRAGRFHVAENLSIVEVLKDGEPCAPGVEGSVTVTNLHALLLPFLRYDTGDRASLGAGDCPCGRSGQTLQAVQGRTWPSVLLPDGREVNPLDLSLDRVDAPHVRRVQLLQRDLEELRVRLEVNAGFSAAEEERIRTFMSEQCQHALRVTVLTDEQMEMTSGGKHPFVIRRV